MKRERILWVARQLARIPAAWMSFWFKEPVWRTAQGEVLLYSEIEDRHLNNIIAMLERACETDTKVYRALIAERGRRWREEAEEMN